MAGLQTSLHPADAASDPGGTLNFAIAALLGLFFIYITVKGELPTYIALFSFTPPAASGAATGAAP